MRILDCTFRDGGYYNNWDFDGETAQYYLKALEATHVDIIEIGFRLLPQEDTFLGPFAYSTDDFLNTLPLPKKTLIGVMIDAKEYLNYSGGIEKAL